MLYTLSHMGHKKERAQRYVDGVPASDWGAGSFRPVGRGEQALRSGHVRHRKRRGVEALQRAAPDISRIIWITRLALTQSIGPITLGRIHMQELLKALDG
jgi:hypothetical protein